MAAKRLCLLLAGLALVMADGWLYAQDDEQRIREISIELRPYDGVELPGYIASADKLERIIDETLLFREGDVADENLLGETERNLLATGRFRSVRIAIDSLDEFSVDVTLILTESRAVALEPMVETGGDAEQFGLGLAGRAFPYDGVYFDLGYRHRSENGIGHEGHLNARFYDVFGLLPLLQGGLRIDSFQTRQQLGIHHPFATSRTDWAFGVQLNRAFGREFFYRQPEGFSTTTYRQDRVTAWISKSFLRDDRFFVTALLALDDTQRDNDLLRQAGDNTGQFLLAFSSLSQDFASATIPFANRSGSVPVGAVGMAVLGRFFPIGSEGEKLFYAGGRIQQAVIPIPDSYLFGQLTAASGFRESQARYTYLGFNGTGHWRPGGSWLVAAGLRQLTAWNWPAFRDVLLDQDAGLRGYALNALAGQNRIVSNIEVRFTSLLQGKGLRLEAAAFYDAGMIWDQDNKIGSNRLHNAVGAGLRLYHSIFGGDDILRLDVAYNADDKNIGQIILSTKHPFPLFGDHQFSLPKFFGREIDRE